MQEKNIEALNPFLEQFSSSGRTALFPALHAAQDLYGYIPEFAAHAISAALKVPLSEVYGVITFYSHFLDKPVGRSVIHVCSDPVCALAGAERAYQQ